MFLNELAKSIESDVTVNSDKIAFNEKKTATKTEKNQSSSVTVYKGEISIKDLIDDQIIEEKDYINLATEWVQRAEEVEEEENCYLIDDNKVYTPITEEDFEKFSKGGWNL